MTARNGSETGPVGPVRARGGARAAGGAEGHEAPPERGGASQVRWDDFQLCKGEAGGGAAFNLPGTCSCAAPLVVGVEVGAFPILPLWR